MSQRHWVVVIGMLLALLASAPPARAQSEQQVKPLGPEKPFRGLFGGNEADPRSRQALDLRISLYGGWEESRITPVDPDAVPPRLESLINMTGYHAGETTSLTYARRGRRVSVNANAGAHLRYYTEQQEFTNASDWASFGFSASLSPRTTLSATQGVTYSPYYSNGFFPLLTGLTPGEPLSPALDYFTFYHPNYTYSTAVNLARRLTPRSSFSAFYNLNYVDFVERGDVTFFQPFRNQMAGARYQYSFTPTFGVHAGYSYVEGRYGWYASQGYPVTGHNIDVGVDYNKTLPLGRRTTFGFATGTSIVKGTAAYGGDEGKYYFNAQVSAYLNTALGRTWNANVNYQRGLMFVQGFQEPWYSDSIGARFGGYLGRRVNVSAQAGWTRGTGYYSAQEGNIDAWTATANLQLAVTRTVALFTQYFYYHYDTRGQQMIPFFAATDFDRRGVRAGLSLWLPLLR